MDCRDGLIASFAGAPEGSALEVWVEGNPNEFIASGRLSVMEADGSTITVDLTHDDLFGTHITRLAGATAQAVYTANVLFSVKQTSTAFIRARVVTPQGQDLDTPYCHKATGVHGKRVTASIGAGR